MMQLLFRDHGDTPIRVHHRSICRPSNATLEVNDRGGRSTGARPTLESPKPLVGRKHAVPKLKNNSAELLGLLDMFLGGLPEFLHGTFLIF